MRAGKGDLKTLANGLFPGGFDAATLTQEGRDEVRSAVDVILRLWDYRNARLTLALEGLDKAAIALEQKDALIAEMLAALKTCFKIPRPWIMGGRTVTEEEWGMAVDAVSAAIAKAEAP